MESLKKKCKVVMLATGQKATDKPFSVGITLCNDNKLRIGNPVGKSEKRISLLIISNDEIESGDWFLTDDRDSIYQNNGNPRWKLYQCTSIFNKWVGIDNNEDLGYNPKWSNKIVATTDKSLSKTSKIEIPEPSPAFIKKFMSEYNKGNIISEVNVDYVYKPISEYAISKLSPYSDINWLSDGEGIIPNSIYLKSEDSKITNSYGNGYVINEDVIMLPKVDNNNHITITKIKDSWNKQEVIDLLNKLASDIDDKYRPFTSDNVKGDELLNDYNWLINNL